MTTDPNTSKPIATAPLPDDVGQCAASIDKLDRQIVDLLILRFRLSRQIGALKAQLGAEPFDPRRIRQQTAVFVEMCEQGGLDEAMATSLIQAVLHRVVSERLEQDLPSP